MNELILGSGLTSVTFVQGHFLLEVINTNTSEECMMLDFVHREIWSFFWLHLLDLILRYIVHLSVTTQFFFTACTISLIMLMVSKYFTWLICYVTSVCCYHGNLMPDIHCVNMFFIPCSGFYIDFLNFVISWCCYLYLLQLFFVCSSFFKN